MTEATAKVTASNSLDLAAVRADFPILAKTVRDDKRLVFLDSAASAQKPRQVIDAEKALYETEYANIHRGVYYLSERSTILFEEARKKTRTFLNAADPHEIVFTRGGTESINLVAESYGRHVLREGDEILITYLEHHSNIVPWQLIAARTGAVVKGVPIADDGSLDMAAFDELLNEKTRIVACTHTSNALGTIPPVREIIRKAHAAGAVVLLDGCQAAPHQAVDVQALDVDFYVVTGHKVYGPSGTGVLYGKKALLDAMPPYQGGGEMIRRVAIEGSTWADVPHKFEAGTPNIAGTIGFGHAIDYVNGLGHDAIAAHEAALLNYATDVLSDIEGLRIVGTAPEKASIVSFMVDGVHPHDLGTILDQEGVAIRAGHHCAQPVMDHFGIAGTARASFAIYNGTDDVDALAAAIRKARELFG